VAARKGKVRSGVKKSKALEIPVEYQVVPNGQRWDVERDDALIRRYNKLKDRQALSLC
jgi:hypothetical protein